MADLQQKQRNSQAGERSAKHINTMVRAKRPTSTSTMLKVSEHPNNRTKHTAGTCITNRTISFSWKSLEKERGNTATHAHRTKPDALTGLDVPGHFAGFAATNDFDTAARSFLMNSNTCFWRQYRKSEKENRKTRQTVGLKRQLI